MNPLISETLKESLAIQFGHEVYNSHLYLYVANFLKGKGLSNIAKLFEIQWEEEQNHARIIYDLITDLGEVFEIPPVSGCNFQFGTILDIGKAYLDREIITTNSLNEIKLLAQSDDDQNPVVEERIREMLKLQQNEYEEATDFFDKCEILGDDWKAVLLWDASLGK